MESYKLLSNQFSKILRKWLTPEEMQKVIRRNAKQKDKRICHSYDFCDANMAMLEAQQALSDVNIHTDVNISQRAWEDAKFNNFAVKNF